MGVIRSGLLGDPISLLLNSMLFGARLIFFPLVWNNINFVLEVLTAILLFLNQLDIFCSSVLTVLIRVGR